MSEGTEQKDPAEVGEQNSEIWIKENQEAEEVRESQEEHLSQKEGTREDREEEQHNLLLEEIAAVPHWGERLTRLAGSSGADEGQAGYEGDDWRKE